MNEAIEEEKSTAAISVELSRAERLRRREERVRKGLEKREKERLEQKREQEKLEDERAMIESEVVQHIRNRAQGKDARGLLLEFVGKTPTTYNEIRKELRKALAKFHPDRARGSLRDRVTNEEIYKTLQPVYERYG